MSCEVFSNLCPDFLKVWVYSCHPQALSGTSHRPIHHLWGPGSLFPPFLPAFHCTACNWATQRELSKCIWNKSGPPWPLAPTWISSFSEFLELLCAKSYIGNQRPPPHLPIPKHSSPKLANYPREVINTDHNQTPWKEPQKCTLPAGECRHQAGDAHHPRRELRRERPCFQNGYSSPLCTTGLSPGPGHRTHGKQGQTPKAQAGLPGRVWAEPR